ncbi:glycosyltransferase family 31 [Lecanosticta acicola]|uniref:N-acetylgalactosaminide beta-1,3-galactosyltransferase n=1 Tax=Lecanosticta acicola TaxID=111012 RepID=A0AAI8Z4A7_9PEZI|nr:glycosyltransferase family 31 [Lecanosticta acicola]
MPYSKLPPKLLLLASTLSIATLCLLLLTSRLPTAHLLPSLGRTAIEDLTHDTAFFPPHPEHCAGNTGVAEDGNPCAGFPVHLHEDIQIVVKTGIGERHRLEALLSTFASCFSNILIMSDVQGKVLGHEVYDVLADLPSSYAVNNPDWEAYETQRKAYKAGEAISKSHQGWKLDRFKFLPMIEKTFKIRPKAKWYVFIESDTYYFWDTLFRVLSDLNPNERHYLGNAVAGADNVWFAYGGAGFVLSKKLMRDINHVTPPMSHKHEELIKGDCCGDIALAYSLYRELEARVEGMYPTFSGDEPSSVEIDEARRCVPLLALHRVSPEQMKSLWKWERCRVYTEAPLTYLDFLDYSLAHLARLAGSFQKSHWDNGANLEQPSNSSMSECFESCNKSPGCLQSTYSEEGTCRFAEFAKSGREVEQKMQSSWNPKSLARLGWTTDGGKSRNVCEKDFQWQEPVFKPFP